MSVVLLAYHEIGYRSLKLLLEREVPVCAVFTHEDSPAEECWFGSVAELAREAGIPTYTPTDINALPWVEAITALAPELLLSVHYRRMVKRPIRRIPRLGSFNLHTSLLPRYRGRCPLNWQLVHGEQSSGVTLHHMVARADAGDIVDQESVPVLADDSALDLYQRLLPAAERLLGRTLEPLLAGTAPRRAQEEELATTFGGRRPEDGRVEWSWPARRIHDLVRAVAPPWPGAFTDTPAGPLQIWRTRLVPPPSAPPTLALGEVWQPTPGETFVQAQGGLVKLEEVLPPPGFVLKSGSMLVRQVRV